MKRAMMALTILTVFAIGGARADLILNGGFEAETINNIGGFTPNSWTLTGNAANYWTGGETSGTGGITAYSGNWFASFSNVAPDSSGSPSGVSGLQQTVSTTLGGEYTLSFYYTVNSTTSTEIKATWDSTVLLDKTSSFGTGWQFASFTVTGTGSDTVAFSGYSNSWNGVDDVSLTSISAPEPSGLALLGMATIIFAGFYGWRLRKLVAA